jgi:osmotically-inducible protein OsmY
MRTVGAFLIGAGTAFFLDPREGRRRRHEARDRTLAFARRLRRRTAKETRRVGGHLLGLAAFRHRLGRADVATDDATVLQRIRSDAFREAGVSTRDVDVDVADGVATLRGSVPTDDMASTLVSRVASTPGVRDVAARLEVSGAQSEAASR